MSREAEPHTNNRWSKGICQTAQPYNSNLYSAPGGNLTGAGEIVGIADTGLDLSSCYFHDPAHPPPFDTFNPAHRKVVSYWTVSGDRLESSEGHGTHVSGSTLGYALNDYGDPKRFNGTPSSPPPSPLLGPSSPPPRLAYLDRPS